MTKTSLTHLATFLNYYQAEIVEPIFDYGGTENIGGDIMRKMLASGGINDYRMLDFDNGFDLRDPIKGGKAGTGLCLDLLEHVSNPFLVAKNIKNSLKKGALLFVTVPWIWEFHPTPQDFWRFTPDGLQTLFDGMEVITIYQVRDAAPEEELPRERIVGIFRKK